MHLSTLLARCSWPFVFFGGLAATHFAFSSHHPLPAFLGVYGAALLILVILERVLPYEKSWLLPDGETGNDIAHTLLTKGLVQVAALAVAFFPAMAAVLLKLVDSAKLTLWPTSWPMIMQVIMAVLVAEFGLYWAHRIAHERIYFWRFHALHHSVTRLWVINTGRFHIADSLFKVTLSQIPLYVLGAPLHVFWWVGAVTAFMGILTHCNVDMQTGPLDLVFSTPRLHRRHHAQSIREGNTNYGENIVLFDQLFGTYFNPEQRPSSRIGIAGSIAKGFLSQLAQPFTRNGVRQILGR